MFDKNISTNDLYVEHDLKKRLNSGSTKITHDTVSYVWIYGSHCSLVKGWWLTLFPGLLWPETVTSLLVVLHPGLLW